MTSTTKARKSITTVSESQPTHVQGLELFQAVKNALLLAGWTQLRVDTLLIPGGRGRDAMTVRHHFDHGVWELYYEADRYWDPHGTPVRTAKIRTDRPGPLPSVESIINDLFGPEVGSYFPGSSNG